MHLCHCANGQTSHNLQPINGRLAVEGHGVLLCPRLTGMGVSPQPYCGHLGSTYWMFVPNDTGRTSCQFGGTRLKSDSDPDLYWTETATFEHFQI